MKQNKKNFRLVLQVVNSLNNQITCFKNDNSEYKIEEKKEEPFGFKEVKKSTYYHEFNHLLTKYGMDSIFTQLSEEVIAMENEEIKRNQYENL